ncbi:MAG: DUF6338 family protein [Coriobacteriia bacterium]|nr:DUF6338 family protein [Coriobacteriia bacterium]
MTVASLDVVLYTCIFILPGFLISGIISHLTPTKRGSDGTHLVLCLLYSVVNYAVWSWLYMFVFSKALDDSVQLFWFVVITLVGASLIAVAISILKQRGFLKWISGLLRLNAINPTPTAWDYLFFNQGSRWLLITLTDGREFYGLFSSNSFVSSGSDGFDIYIEKIYSFEDGGSWSEIVGHDGLYLQASMIRSVEFFKGEENHE